MGAVGIPAQATPEWRRLFAREAARKRQRGTVSAAELAATWNLTLRLPLAPDGETAADQG